MSKTPRAVVTREIELPTPLQQVKLDSLYVRLLRAGREVYYVNDDSELPEFYARPHEFAIWLVIWKGKPEGIIYVHEDGKMLGTAVHKGLAELVHENAVAGGWMPDVPYDYYATPGVLGNIPVREEVEALHREYGWID